jgi:hypothetical protein
MFDSMNPEIEALRRRVQALSPRVRKALLKQLMRPVRDLDKAAAIKPHSRKAIEPDTWRLGTSPVRATAISQHISPAARKRATAKRIGIATPIRYDEET